MNRKTNADSPLNNKKPNAVSPLMNRKPKPSPSTKPKLDAAKLGELGEKGGKNWAEIPKPVENRGRSLMPTNSISGRSSESKKSPEKHSTSPVGKKACLFPPNKPTKPVSLGGISPKNPRQRRRSSSPEDLSLDSHEVKLAIMNTPDEEMLKMNFTTPQKGSTSKPSEDLENTLTNSLMKDLESTLVGTGEESNEWVMVKKKKEDEEKGKNNRTSVAGDSPVSRTNKKLPSPPTKKRSSSGSSVTPSSPAPTLSAETNPSSPKRGGSSRVGKSNKMNSLMDKFSVQSAAPPPQPGRVYGPGRSGGAEGPDGKPKPPAKPAGGVAPVEAVAPSSMSNGLLSGKWVYVGWEERDREGGAEWGRGLKGNYSKDIEEKNLQQ